MNKTKNKKKNKYLLEERALCPSVGIPWPKDVVRASARKYRKLKRLSEKKGVSLEFLLLERAKRRALDSVSIGKLIPVTNREVTYLGKVLGIWKGKGFGKRVALEILGILSFNGIQPFITISGPRILGPGSMILRSWEEFSKVKDIHVRGDTKTVGELVREKINFLQKKKKEDSRGFWSEYEKSWESFFKTFTLDRVNELTQGRFVNTRVNGENRVY